MKYLSSRLSAAMWARVLLLWLTLFVGAIVVGGIAFWLGGFIQGNIRNELTSQQITFTAADKLTDEEKQLPGIVENAGLELRTGNQAQAYAGLIGLHLKEASSSAGYPDASYATLGGIQGTLRAAVATAKTSGDQAAIDKANADLTAATNLRNTMLTGNTLRGNLLSAYGWDNVATGVQATGVVILVLALVFLILFIYELQHGHLPPLTEAQ
ncbi:MAG: hypothetical protein ABI947_26845 [Chloroflexota bacterium]